MKENTSKKDLLKSLCIMYLHEKVRGGENKLPIKDNLNKSYESVFAEFPECKQILLDWKHCCYPCKENFLFNTLDNNLGNNLGRNLGNTLGKNPGNSSFQN